MNRRSFLRGLAATVTAAVAPLPLLGEGEAPGPVLPMLARWRWSGRFYDAPALWSTFPSTFPDELRPQVELRTMEPLTIDFTRSTSFWLMRRLDVRTMLVGIAREDGTYASVMVRPGLAGSQKG